MTLKPRPSLLVTAVILGVLPFILPNNYTLDIAIRIALASVAVIGLNFLMGFAGQISIGHAGFIAIGSYGSAIAAGNYGLPPIVSIGVAALGSAIMSWIVAKPILRLKGHSLTMATLGFGIIVNMVLVNEGAISGGPDGMAVLPLAVGRFTFAKLGHWYALVATLLWVAIWFSLNLYESPAGRSLRGLHGSEVAARVVGVDVSAFKVRAFVISAVFASLSGSLLGHYLGFISPTFSSFTHSVELATMVVLGGMASTYGAVLGAALLTLLPQLFGGLHGFESILFGLVLMLTMIYLPRGIVPTLALKLRRSA